MALAEILRTLVRREVRFIVVGGTAGVLQGAPIHTLDLDIVYAIDEENVACLDAALRELGAIFRGDSRKLAPNPSHLRSRGHKLLVTREGALDVLGAIEVDAGYDQLLPDADILDLGGIEVRVLSLERLIAVKEKLDRPKDRVMLEILRATLAERPR
ncbi:MAG: hypothetical protein NVS3B10_19660 [Polyangiales bacterium]